MYHWVYLSTSEFNGVGAMDVRTYTALAPSALATPVPGDMLVLCEKVTGIYDISREAAYEVTAVQWVASPNGGAPCGVRWTAELVVASV